MRDNNGRGRGKHLGPLFEQKDRRRVQTLSKKIETLHTFGAKIKDRIMKNEKLEL